MAEEIPEIYFDRNKPLDIEVVSLEDTFQKLAAIKHHDPFAIHRIQFFLILVVTKNTCTHFLDFNTYKLAPGSALFIAQNQIHHFNRDLEQANGFGIILSRSFFEKNFLLTEGYKLNRLFNYHIESPVVHQEDLGEDSLLDIAGKLYEEYENPNPFVKAEMLQTLLQVLLLKAERAKEIQSVDGTSVRWLELFNRFKTSLEKNYVKTRNSKEYAADLLVSYKFLNNVVKQMTGKTIKAFIDDYVTIEIKRYLISTSFSVKEIGYKTGFDEPANMVKFFKKNTQTTPLKYRQR